MKRRNIQFVNLSREVVAILDAARPSTRSLAEGLFLREYEEVLEAYAFLADMIGQPETAGLIDASESPYGLPEVGSSSPETVRALARIEKARRTIGIELAKWPAWLAGELEIMRGGMNTTSASTKVHPGEG